MYGVCYTRDSRPERDSLPRRPTLYDEEIYQSTLSKGGGWYSFNGELLSVISGSHTVTSTSKRRWWERSASRPYHATLPYTVERFRTTNTNYRYDTSDAPWISWFVREEYGYYQAVDVDAALGFTHSPELSGLATEMLEKAQNACFDALAGQVWNAPVFFAELHKTGELVTDWANKISSSAGLLWKHRNPRVAIKALRKQCNRYLRGYRPPKGSVSQDAASFWLQWRYAVETGMMDVANAARTTADLLLDKSNQVTARITQTRSGAVEMEDVVIPDSSWGRFIGLGLSLGSNVDHRLSRVGHVEAKAWFDAIRTNSFLTDVNQFGLLNVPVVIWELTPLSFVADWVLDVGSFLERTTAGAGYNLVNGGFQVFRRVAGRHKVVLYFYYVTPNRLFQSEGASYEVSRYNRNAWASPSPTWTPKIRMNTKRWLDAASLIRNIPLGRFKAF